MAKYTVLLRDLIRFSTDNSIRNDIEAIESARALIFDFNYPFNEDFKKELETNFIRHFYMNEICAETIDLWKIFLIDTFKSNAHKWNDIFNKIVENSEKLFETGFTYTETHSRNYSSIKKDSNNIVDTTNVATTEIGTDSNNRVEKTVNDSKGDSTNNVTENGEKISKHNDTPQGLIDVGNSNVHLSYYDVENTNNDVENSMLQKSTLNIDSTIGDTKNTTNDVTMKKNDLRSSENNGSISDLENITINNKNINYDKYLETVKGYTELENFYNIFYKDCQDLFMLVWR